MKSVPAGSGPHVLRRMNAASVLSALRQGGPSRIADLMRSTELSRPAVTRAVESLRAEGWVGDGTADRAGDEQGDGQHERHSDGHARLGRPAALLRFRAEAGHVLGVDVGPHKVVAMVADLAGDVVAEHRADTRGLDGRAVLDAIVSVTARAAADVPESSLLSAAVGTPGLVDPETGAVTLAPSIPGWDQIPIAATLRERLACPVTVHNDVNLAVLAERWCGVAAAIDNLVFLQWGARVGTGIVIDGRLHIGAAGAAGELGFLDLQDAGRQSTDSVVRKQDSQASTMGPFERQVGAAAVIELAISQAAQKDDAQLLSLMRAAQADDDAAVLFDAARDGSALAEQIIDTICGRMAGGLAALQLILAPDLIVIGGGLSRAGDQLLDAVDAHLRERTLAPPRLALSTLGDTAVVLGAVRSALSDVESRVLGIS
ncbi:ROK family transcriptional regulator [Flexivirga sp. B27]